MCAVTFSAAAPIVSTTQFVPSVDVTPVEPGRKLRRLESPREKAKILTAFEELWASSQSFLPHLVPPSAPQPPLVTPLVVIPVAVSVASACSDSYPRSAASSSVCVSGRFLFLCVFTLLYRGLQGLTYGPWTKFLPYRLVF